MMIAGEYAVVSEDGKSLLLPAEVHSCLKGIDRLQSYAELTLF